MPPPPPPGEKRDIFGQKPMNPKLGCFIYLAVIAFGIFSTISTSKKSPPEKDNTQELLMLRQMEREAAQDGRHKDAATYRRQYERTLNQ